MSLKKEERGRRYPVLAGVWRRSDGGRKGARTVRKGVEARKRMPEHLEEG